MKQDVSIVRSIVIVVCSIFCSVVVGRGQNYQHHGFDESNSAYSVDVNIFNRYDDHFIDTSYMGNQEVFHMLDSLMRDTLIINHTRMINVSSSSSIEGSVPYNTALSRRRMRTIEATFRSRYSFIPAHMWNFGYIPENWRHLRGAVLNDNNVPNQKEVLSIIDMVDIDADVREDMLKQLDGGVSWSYIHKHILPSSRGSVSMLFVPIESPPVVIDQPLPAVDIKMAEIELATPSIELRSPTFEQKPDSITKSIYSRPIMSIRSNLPLDLVSIINIGVEVPIAPRWSIAAEYIYPWWKSWDHNFTLQIESLYFDLRYWFSSRERHNYLTGWSGGLYIGSGRYDIQPLTKRGVQGEYLDYGATVSYSHFLGRSKHWLMEYSVGLGYVSTHYRNYYPVDNSDEYGNIKVHYYPWSEETLRAPLPTRLAITLVYLISVDGLKKRGGRRR